MAKDFVEQGRALLVKREYEEVVRVCRAGLADAGRARRGSPELEVDGRVVLAHALAGLGRWREVLFETDVVIARSARTSVAWRLRGQAMLGAEDYTQAEECLRRAKELDPKDGAVSDLLAELAVARQASQRSFSAAELTDHHPTNTDGGGSMTATDVRAAVHALAGGDTMTTGVPIAQEVRTEIDIEVPSDPNIPALPVLSSPTNDRLASSRRPSAATTPAPSPAAPMTRIPDHDDRTMPIPYGDVMHEERTDVRTSTRVDPLLIPHDVRPVLVPMGGTGETTGVPAALPPPPAPPKAPVSNDLYGRGRGDAAATGGRGSWRAIVLLFMLAIAGGIAALLYVRAERGRSTDGLAQRALAQVGTGAYPSLSAAQKLLADGDVTAPTLVWLRARLAMECALFYGTPRPAPPAQLDEAAQRGERDALDAATLFALARGDLDGARRFAAEHEQRYHEVRSRFLAGLVAANDGHLAEAASVLRSAATESHYGPAFIVLARVEEALGRRDGARGAWQTASTQSPQLFLARIEASRAEIRWAGAAVDAHLLDTLVLPATASVGEAARAKLALAELAIAKHRTIDARRSLDEAIALASHDDGWLAADLARALAEIGDLAGAETQARAAFDAGANDGRLLLAEIVRRRGHADEALTLLASDASPESRVARAEAELALGRPTAAKVECDAALQQSPGMVSALIVLARVELAMGHPGDARAHLERLTNADPSGRAAALLADIALADRQRVEARRLVAIALLAKSTSTAHSAAAHLAIAEGDNARAAMELGIAADLDPGDPQLQRERAELAMRTGDLKHAAEALAKVPTRAGHFASARAYLLLGDPKNAAAEVERGNAAAGLASDGELQTRLRLMLLDGKAKDALERAHELVAVNVRAAFRARALIALGQLADAEHELAALDRRDDEATYLHARIAVERGKPSGALDAVLSTIDAHAAPELRAEVDALLGRLAFEKGAFPKAVNYLDEAVRLYPGLAEAQLYLGLSANERGDRARARAALSDAVRLAPSQAEPEYYLGRMLVADDPTNAKPHLEHYLALAPKGAFAADARTLLKRL